jgi:monoamine oxidase
LLYFNSSGAAGLTAAYDLKRKHIPVQVLEANATHVGGRVRKLEGFADFTIDAGGEDIHMHPSLFSQLVDDPKFSYKDHFDAQPYKYSPFYEYVDNDWTLTHSKVEDEKVLWKFVDYSWAQFFHDFMAKPILDDIQLGCVVQRIDYTDKDRVAVTCTDGRVFYGRQVIVTVSLPVLQDGDISFLPALPQATKHAIDSIPFGLGLKVFFEFSSKFYYDNFRIHKQYKDCHGEVMFYDETAFRKSNKHILTVYVYGDVAKNYINLDDDAIIKMFLEELDEAYDGNATRTYKKGFVQNWSSDDSYVRGAFSSYRNGMKYMYPISQPVDSKIFFAGEHLPPDGSRYGYVHGAALSGRNAAEAVQCIRKGEQPGFMWKMFGVHVLGTIFFGLEQKYIFNDLD